MRDLDAYRETLRPHRHDWQPLGDDYQWCPGCGHVRPFNPEHAGA